MGQASRLKREARRRQTKLLHKQTFLDEVVKAVERQSRQTERAQSLWDEAAAAEQQYRSRSDTAISFASVERGLRMISDEKSEWAGIPMPLDGERLVVEKSYPFASAFEKINAVSANSGSSTRVCRNEDVNETTFLRNTFWSWRWRCDVTIWEVNGKIEWGVRPSVNHMQYDLVTVNCAQAWNLENEFRAMGTLRELVGHHKFRQYFLTGSFLETSQRSKITYMFRRLKPTIAITTRTPEPKILCALCQHPVAYYEGSWAGALCPTDDVIAHYCLMKGDERMFWKRSNQHPAHRPEAGI